jgi:hypothetical protein
VFVYFQGSVEGGPMPAPFAAHGGVYPPDAGAIPTVAHGRLTGTGPHLLEARLDPLLEVINGPDHLGNGMKLIGRLPSAEFWRLGSPP